ncbi:protein DPCD [Bicyclus anynana]|uniref:Protein DPCD n=1 Tax=Bicyclus anynana TaxID=110368 RepID=A0A6J1ND38_BICAN|nr:protein DPCD [Bicyclus anynana]
MKRKTSPIDSTGSGVSTILYKISSLTEEISPNIDSGLCTKKIIIPGNHVEQAMAYKNSIWYKSLLNAEKTCLKEDQIKKIHYKFEDGNEMVEEYNADTRVLLRRAWKVKGKIGGEGKWLVEIGDPIPDAVTNTDALDIKESKDQPVLLKRNTKINIEWRIRNLPYPIETYSIKANDEEKHIVISTSNKKYYKKLEVPELVRVGLPIEQSKINATHQFNTLIITYNKPQTLIEMEKEWYQELNKIKPMKDIPNECKTQ